MNIELLKLVLTHHPDRLPVLMEAFIRVVEPQPHYPAALRAISADEENRDIMCDALLAIPNSIPREALKQALHPESLRLRDKIQDINFSDLEPVLQDPLLSYMIMAWCDTSPSQRPSDKYLAQTREVLTRYWKGVVLPDVRFTES